MVTFQGYRRPDGSVGVRNYVLVLPTVICANRVALHIGERVPGVVAIPHVHGCDFDAERSARSNQTFIGFACNPNVGAVLLVSLGCETADGEYLASQMEASGKPVELIRIQEEGGTHRTAEKGADIARQFQSELNRMKRERFPLSELMMATECGGSDAHSGLSGNPAVGVASDRVVEEGGTVILSETSEIVGAEEALARRAISDEVKADLLRVVERAERDLAFTTPEADGVYISPGNMEGGLTTIEEKSLGCIYKAGSSPLVEVVDYAVRPSRRGLVVMDTPGYDVASITGMIAGGAQIVVFTTGRGTPTGCPIAPVLKVATNSATYYKMEDDLDINAGTILEGTESIAQVGGRIFEALVHVASGDKTKSERWSYGEFAIAYTSVAEAHVLCQRG